MVSEKDRYQNSTSSFVQGTFAHDATRLCFILVIVVNTWKKRSDSLVLTHSCSGNRSEIVELLTEFLTWLRFILGKRVKVPT